MSPETLSWVFTPVASMTARQLLSWLDDCYVASEVDQILADPVRSVVISTYGGSGITTSLALLLQTSRLLILPYNVEQWPGSPGAFTRAGTHFGQWMARFVDAVMAQLRMQPTSLTLLNPYQHQFVLWLLERHIGKRQSKVWQSELDQQLPSALREQLEMIVAEEPVDYGDTVADLKYQLHECVAVARALGWEGVYASVDINWWDWCARTPNHRERIDAGLRDLLTTLAPLEVPYFGVKLAIPARLLSPQEVDRLTRSRIRPMIYPMTYSWSEEQLHRICRRHVACAAADSGVEIASPPSSLWAWLEGDIRSIWEWPCPAAARALALVWLELADKSLEGEVLHHQLRAALYRLAAPLRRDGATDSQVVYRGQTAIHLDDMPFRLFSTLWQHRGSPASNEALLSVAGSKANLDKLISRLREQIEPLHGSGTTIYLQRRPNSGAWLDATTAVFSS